MRTWVNAALQARVDKAEMGIRVVDEAESALLNQTYRHKTGATNVLSFPFEMPLKRAVRLLGDLVICAPIVKREASLQGKSLEAHWAHLVVHGALHLVGFDHEKADEAAIMEALEVEVLQRLDFPNPYQEGLND